MLCRHPAPWYPEHNMGWSRHPGQILFPFPQIWNATRSVPYRIKLCQLKSRLEFHIEAVYICGNIISHERPSFSQESKPTRHIGSFTCSSVYQKLFLQTRMKQGHLSHVSLLPQFYPARLENSAVRGNDRQNPPPENKLIPCLIEVALVQMRRLAVHASCQLSDYLKTNPFGLCSDSHIHFLLNPLTSIIWLFNLVYIIAPYLSQKLPSMEMTVIVLMSGFLSM